LLNALSASAEGAMPVVDEGEDLLPARQEPSDGHRIPEMFGYLGDGELQVEVCPSAPTAGWALAWVRHVREDPTGWRAAGRVWARFGPEEAWWDCERDDPKSLEFWELRKIRFEE
jgi:hypothetical protein